MLCPKCQSEMEARRSTKGTGIIAACPSCGYSECFVSDAEVARIIDNVFKEMNP